MNKAHYYVDNKNTVICGQANLIIWTKKNSHMWTEQAKHLDIILIIFG